MLPGGRAFLVATPATSLAVGGDVLGAFSLVICGFCSTLDAAGCGVQGRCSLHLPVTAAAVGGRRSCACFLGVEEQLLLSLFALAVGFLSIFRGAHCLAVSIRYSVRGSVTGLRIVAQLLPVLIQVVPLADI